MKMNVQHTAGSCAFKYLGSITRAQPDPSRLHHCGLRSTRHFRLLAARDRQRLPTHARQARSFRQRQCALGVFVTHLHNDHACALPQLRVDGRGRVKVFALLPLLLQAQEPQVDKEQSHLPGTTAAQSAAVKKWRQAGRLTATRTHTTIMMMIAASIRSSLIRSSINSWFRQRPSPIWQSGPLPSTGQAAP